jgi:hypothetical protein
MDWSHWELENCRMEAGNNKTLEAKMGGMTPEVLTFRGR